MIHEFRSTTFAPGHIPEIVKLAGEVGLPARGSEAGVLKGWFHTELGDLNTVLEIWEWTDLEDRRWRLDALQGNTAWAERYLAPVERWVRHREVTFAKPEWPVKPMPGEGHFYEMRTYRTMPGQRAAWAKAFGAMMKVREKYSQNIGFWTTESGDPEQAMHCWAYRDLKERSEVRARVLQDPEWQAFIAWNSPMLAHLRSTILVPAPFSPLR